MPQTEAVRKGFRQIRIAVLVVGSILVILTLALGWFGDDRSCERQVDIRRALIDTREINRDSIPFWERRGETAIAARLQGRVDADKHIKQLDCDRILPGT